MYHGLARHPGLVYMFTCSDSLLITASPDHPAGIIFIDYMASFDDELKTYLQQVGPVTIPRQSFFQLSTINALLIKAIHINSRVANAPC